MNFLPLPHPSAFYHHILYPVLKLQKKKKEKKKGKGLIILRNWHRTIYNTSRVLNHTYYYRSTQFAHSGSQIIPVTTGRPNSLTPRHKSYLLPQVDPIRSLRVTNRTCYHRSTQSTHSGSQTIPVTTGRILIQFKLSIWCLYGQLSILVRTKALQNAATDWEFCHILTLMAGDYIN